MKRLETLRLTPYDGLGESYRPDIADGLVKGELPRRALALLVEWYQLHKAELEQDWELARERRPLKRIAPLE